MWGGGHLLSPPFCGAEPPLCPPPQVSLKIEEEEARHALQDAALVGSILARGLL